MQLNKGFPILLFCTTQKEWIMGILCEIYEVFQEYYKYKIKSATLSIHFGKQNYQNWSMEINMHNFQKVSFYKKFEELY